MAGRARWRRRTPGQSVASHPPAKVLNQATGVVLVILGVAVAAFRLFM